VFLAILSDIISLIIFIILINRFIASFNSWDFFELSNNKVKLIFKLFTTSKHFDKRLRLLNVNKVSN
jgi:hypothetical protein